MIRNEGQPSLLPGNKDMLCEQHNTVEQRIISSYFYAIDLTLRLKKDEMYMINLEA